MLRVLFVITDLEVGGVPLHLLRLASGVRDLGYAVRVVSLRSAGAVGDWLRERGVEVASCEAAGPADWRVVERLVAQMAEFSPDLVHSLLFHANVASRLACVLGGFPSRRLVCEIQTVEIERTWHLTVDRWTHRLCALTIGNSRSVVEHLHRYARIPRDRLRVVEGGIDVAAIRSAERIDRVSLGVTDEDHMLLWVGRMDPIKGLDTLVAAADLLVRSLPVKVVLAGDGEQRPAVEADIARRGLGDCVRLLGRRDDVARLMRTADVFVFPSRTEGMPNVLLEAMAAELPIVTTDVPGCRDVVTEGDTGRLVPADDPVALAVAVRDVLADGVRSQAMTKAALDLVGREHTQDACVARYTSLYGGVVDPTAVR